MRAIALLMVVAGACSSDGGGSGWQGLVLDDGAIYTKPAEEWNGYYEVEWTCLAGNCDGGGEFPAAEYYAIRYDHATIVGVPADEEGSVATMSWHDTIGPGTGTSTSEIYLDPDGQYHVPVTGERFGRLEIYGTPTGFGALETYTPPDGTATSDWELIATLVGGEGSDAGP